MIKTFLVKIETESRYVYDKQKTPWKVLCTVFIHSSFRNIKLTRSLRSLVRFMILHDSWIKTVRTHFPWSILYLCNTLCLLFIKKHRYCYLCRENVRRVTIYIKSNFLKFEKLSSNFLQHFWTICKEFLSRICLAGYLHV